VKVSKINASNQRSGVSAELEDLRTKLKISEELKDSLQKRLDDIEHTTQIEDEKKRKVTFTSLLKFLGNQSVFITKLYFRQLTVSHVGKRVKNGRKPLRSLNQKSRN